MILPCRDPDCLLPSRSSPGRTRTTRFVARVAITTLTATALELAWTLRLAARGGASLALVLLGANAALALGLCVAGAALVALVERGWGLSARLAAASSRPRAARAADAVVVATSLALGAEVVVAAVAAAHGVVSTTIKTAAFRGPLLGLVALAAAALVALVGPGACSLVRRPVSRARPALQWAVATLGALAWLAAVAAVLRALGGTLAELDPQAVLGLLVPLVALAFGWLAGPRVATRLPGRAAAVVAALLLLAPLVAAGLLSHRRVLSTSVATLALQSRRLAALAATVSRRAPAPPGRAARLFPLLPPAPSPTSAARHLVLVTIDALRFDRAFPPAGSALSRRRLMPRLAALAAKGTRFDAALCTVPGSLRAIPSILTGRYANALAWRRPAQVTLDAGRTRSLAELLAAAGFDTVFVPHTRYVMNQGTTQGFARVLDPVLLPEADRRRKKPRDVPMVTATLDELGRRLAVPGARDRRLFLWSHFIDPHAPYWDHRRFGASEQDRYDAEAATTDRALGMLLDGLDALGILRDAIVVVTADHGEEFGEHGTTRHSRTVWDAAVRVPLVVVVPGGHPRRVREPVSHVDLVPTLLPLLGLPTQPGLDGRSLAAAVLAGTPPPARTLIVVTYPMYDRLPAEYAAVRGEHKLVTDRQGVATGLYDTRRDPLERDNLLDEAPASLVRALEADVSRYRTRGLGRAVR